jgi:hypothetical protein
LGAGSGVELPGAVDDLGYLFGGRAARDGAGAVVLPAFVHDPDGDWIKPVESVGAREDDAEVCDVGGGCSDGGCDLKYRG